MIIIDSVSPVEHGRGSVRSKYTLYADTMDEVPLTGAETKPLISGLEDDLPPTTLLYTGDYQIAVLDTYDHWRWKSESEDDTNVFYVYHSGRPAASAIETVHITSYIEEHGYDLTRNRTKGTYYGGYALAAGVTPSDDAYDGSNWTWTTMETADGTHLSPVADTVYYVKEVPWGYLHGQAICGTTGGKVTSMIPVFGLDDPKYNGGGWIFNDTNEHALGGAKTTLTINGHSYTAASLWGDLGVTAGRVAYKGDSTLFNGYIAANTSVTIKCFWETQDGIRVYGRTTGTLYWNDLTLANMVWIETPDPEMGA